MGGILHACARTTAAMRRDIQNSQESIASLARRYGINPKRVAKEVTPKRVEQILDAYLTPKGIINLANQGGNIETADLGLNKLIKQLNRGAKNNATGGDDFLAMPLSKYSQDLSLTIAEQNATNAKANHSQKTNYGLDNIKSFGFNGPLAFEVGLAKSPSAKIADVLAGMSFTEMDWKVNKLIPSL